MPLGDERAARALRGRLVSHVPQEPAASLNPSLRIGDAIGDVLRAHLPDEPRREAAAQALRRREPAGDAPSSCTATRTSSPGASSSG